MKASYHSIKNCTDLCGPVTVTDLSHSASRLTSQGAARKFFSLWLQTGTAVLFSKSAFDLGLLSASRPQWRERKKKKNCFLAMSMEYHNN